MSTILAVCTMLILSTTEYSTPIGTKYVDVMIWPTTVKTSALRARFFLKGSGYEIRWLCTCGLKYNKMWRATDDLLNPLDGAAGNWSPIQRGLLCD